MGGAFATARTPLARHRGEAAGGGGCSCRRLQSLRGCRRPLAGALHYGATLISAIWFVNYWVGLEVGIEVTGPGVRAGLYFFALLEIVRDRLERRFEFRAEALHDGDDGD